MGSCARLQRNVLQSSETVKVFFGGVAGGKVKADKESKMKDLTEKVGMALLRIGAESPPDYIQRDFNMTIFWSNYSDLTRPHPKR